ncbi:MAG: 1,4-dihydroxy-2-naphthoate octaprenyltransferase, partial [Muribaculaceae bacterium]|nr:1,4-dihydroxy-2-naphthoate octaprenyltransferase [Muribaculaceae bacterium]
MSSTVKSWIEAMRLRTLPVSVAGVIAGGGCAAYYNSFKPAPFFICLMFAVMAQVVSNFANEYFDFRNGLDKKGREGFRRGVTEGDITPQAMLYATIGLLALTCALGCTLIIWGGWELIFIGIAIAIFALAYSAGPWPLSHHGFGEIAVLIFFGIVPVMFTAYVQVLSWQIWPVALPISLAIGLMGANVLIVNNYRDMEDDRSVNKKTTAVIFGRKTMGNVYFING